MVDPAVELAGQGLSGTGRPWLGQPVGSIARSQSSVPMPTSPSRRPCQPTGTHTVIDSHSQPWLLSFFPGPHPTFSSSCFLPLLYQPCWPRSRARLICSQYLSNRRSCSHRPDVIAAAGLLARLRPVRASSSSQAAPLGLQSRQ